MDRPATRDQQPLIDRQGVQVSEPAPPRTSRTGLDQRQPARQRDSRQTLEPLALPAAAHSAPAYLDEPRRRRIETVATVALAIALAAIVAVVQTSLAASVLRGIMVLALVPCAAIDLDRRIIPNRITGPASVVAIAVGLALDSGGETARLLSALAAGGFLLLAALASPSGMGMGDVKLTAMMGLFLGPAVAVALLAALIASAIAGILIATKRGIRRARETALPLGPYLAAGGIWPRSSAIRSCTRTCCTCSARSTQAPDPDESLALFTKSAKLALISLADRL